MPMNKIVIHPLTWLFAAAAAATGLFLEASCVALLLFVHEMGHAAAAKALRWRISKIEMLPFGGKLETDEHAGRPLVEEWLVVTAGPFMHVPMFAVSVLLFKAGWIGSDFYQLIVQLNAFLLLFNLLPVLPLDGGKMVQLLLCTVQPYYKAYRQSIFFSFMFLTLAMAAAVFTLSFYAQLVLTASYIAVQLLLMWKEKEVMFIRFLTSRHYHPVSLRLLHLNVQKTDRLLHAVRVFKRNRKHILHVKGNGELTEEQLLQSFFEGKKYIQEVDENND